MKENMTDENKPKEFDGFYVTALIFRYKYYVLIPVFLLTAASVVYSLYLPNWYKSTTNVVPPNNVGGIEGAIGGLSSTLKEFGLSKLGQQAGAESYSFLVVLNSRSVVDSVIKQFDLAKVYDIPDTMMEDVRIEFSANVEIDYSKEGNYTVAIWDKDKNRAAEMANQYVNIANHFANKLFMKEIELSNDGLEKRLEKTDSTLAILTDSLKTFSEKYLIFSPDEQAKSISESVSELKSQELKFDIMAEYYKNMYGSDDYLAVQQESFKESIGQKIKDITNKPGFAGNFSISGAAGIGIEYTRLLTEFEMYSKVKAFLLPVIEKNRIDKFNDKKNVIVLDTAIPAEKKDRPKRSLIVAGTFAGSFALAIFLILVFNSINSFTKKYKSLNQSI